MKLSRLIYRIGLIKQEVEFSLILVWLLFYPEQNSHVYFFIFALLMVIFVLRNILFFKNYNLSRFGYCLLFFNFFFIYSIFFSNYIFKSLIFYSDILLVSIYFILFFLDRSDRTKYFYLVFYIISIFSFFIFLNYIFDFIDKNKFLGGSIFQGVAAGFASLIAVFFLIKKFSFKLLFLLLVNLLGVLISGSKAAFIGLILFGLYLIFLKKKKLVYLVLVFTVLVFIVPNPMKKMFQVSLKKDPYAFDRINIWKMSLNIFKDNLYFGVGLDNFSEVSKRYNFLQTKGPANYFKVPKMAHNDYLQIVVETGLPGFILLIMLLFLLLKRIFSPPFFDLTKVLILFLLFQALFFNIVFHVFYFFVLIFLLKVLFEKTHTFKSNNLHHKFLFSFLMIFIFIFSYLTPLLSDILVEKARKSDNISQAFDLIQKAGALTPLNIKPFYFKALLSYELLAKSFDLDLYSRALTNLKKIQKLNGQFLSAYLLEADLNLKVLGKKLKYIALENEIINPLNRAEEISPYNPFIKLKKARIYLEFSHDDQAKEQAEKALQLEPDFIPALCFLHENFNYFGSEGVFKNKINEVLVRIKNLRLKPGSYLFRLFYRR